MNSTLNESTYHSTELVEFLAQNHGHMLHNLVKTFLVSGHPSGVPWSNKIEADGFTLGQLALKNLSGVDRLSDRVFRAMKNEHQSNGETSLAMLMELDGVDLTGGGDLLPYAFTLRAVDFIRYCWEIGHVNSEDLLHLGRNLLPDYTSCYTFKTRWEGHADLMTLANLWYEEKFEKDWMMPRRTEMDLRLTRNKRNWTAEEADRFILGRLWTDYLDETQEGVNSGGYSGTGHGWGILTSRDLSQDKKPLISLVSEDTWGEVASLDVPHGLFFRKLAAKASDEIIGQIKLPEFSTQWLRGELFERHFWAPEKSALYTNLAHQFIDRLEQDVSSGADDVYKVLFEGPPLDKDCLFIERVHTALAKRGARIKTPAINPQALDENPRESLALFSLLAKRDELEGVLGFWNSKMALVKNRARGEETKKCGIIAKVLWCRLKDDHPGGGDEQKAALWINLLQSDPGTVGELIDRMSHDDEVFLEFAPPKNHRALMRMISKLNLNPKLYEPNVHSFIRRIALLIIANTPTATKAEKIARL